MIKIPEIRSDSQYKISFCIICMNRLDQLKQTFLKNLLDNSNYSKLEIILLDYNSQDEMESWAKENLNIYIQLGRVLYFKTYQPQAFNHSHAKNLAFKLATGDVICNINADHFIGEKFANYVNDKFQADSNIVITPIHALQSNGITSPKDVFGKVCVKKSDFIKVKGFDERMKTYGFEDFDFINRLEMIGLTRVILNNTMYLNYLPHVEERFSIEDFYTQLDMILIQHINHFSTNVIFIYQSGVFEMGKIIDAISINASNFKYCYSEHSYRFEYSVENLSWISGSWKKDGKANKLFFITDTGESFILKDKYSFFEKQSNLRERFYIMNNNESKIQILNFHYLFKNRSLLELNILENKICPNIGGFGEGIVYKNFDLTTGIKIC